MPKRTTTYTLGTSWVKVASAGQTLYAQVYTHTGQVYYAYKKTSPATSDIGHTLDAGETYADKQIKSSLWMRSSGYSKVAVTTGGTATDGYVSTTESFSLTSNWVQVSTAGESVHLDMANGTAVHWAYSSAAPATLTEGHVLRAGDEYVDDATDENIWARSISTDANTATATLIVTHG